MGIKDRILEDIKQAMRDKDSRRRDALRLLSSAIKQVEVDKRISLSDDDCIKILMAAYKQREDASASYSSAGRVDLLEKEQYEMRLIETYLPTQLSDDELENELRCIISGLGLEGLSSLGYVMAASKSLSGKASNKRISEMARKLLG